MPSPKKVWGRRSRVRSKIWSGITISPGLMRSVRMPTALADSRWVTPACFRAWMLARYGTSVGVSLCPLPCRGMNQALRPEILASIRLSEGGPYGVSTGCSATTSTPSIW